ncbi:MAG: hypothetical protein VB101_01815 [Rhodospirillaceae bacterium]|nr:hypothetical protein [Rhodospirillaceae bacterium]
MKLGCTVLTLAAFLAAAGTGTAAVTSETPACRTLTAHLDAAPPGPVFLASYPGAPLGPLHETAFLYDNAAAAIALIGCGEAGKARRIGEAILAVLDRDRFWHDGRLRNAYAAGTVGPGSARLPGWWDQEKNIWVEDRYQVGSDNGNMAWAMLALLALDRATGETVWRDGAARIGHWVAGFGDDHGPGGFRGGTFSHEPSPEALSWKSTEHNTDLFAAFNALYAATGDAVWKARADHARSFVDALWLGTHFGAGAAEDGVTPNPFLALDAQIWPALAVPGVAARHGEAIQTALARLAEKDGYAYGEAKGGAWTEGTAQAALLMALWNKDAVAGNLLHKIAEQRAPDGYYFAAPAGQIPTGFMLQTDPAKPRLYFHLPHLGATAWAALAQTGFNPFTGTHALPGPDAN